MKSDITDCTGVILVQKGPLIGTMNVSLLPRCHKRSMRDKGRNTNVPPAGHQGLFGKSQTFQKHLLPLGEKKKRKENNWSTKTAPKAKVGGGLTVWISVLNGLSFKTYSPLPTVLESKVEGGIEVCDSLGEKHMPLRKIDRWSIFHLANRNGSYLEVLFFSQEKKVAGHVESLLVSFLFFKRERVQFEGLRGKGNQE